MTDVRRSVSISPTNDPSGPNSRRFHDDDLYNLFNSNAAVGYDGTYDYGTTDGGGWLQPTSIVQPRFVRLNLAVSF